MPIAHIDLNALRHNLELLRARLSDGCRILAAVKANGYGHGAAEIARTLEAVGVEWFGVATPQEALELREKGITSKILLFGPAFSHIPELVEADVALTIPNNEALEAVRRSGTAGPARVHLKVDTGMGRIGHPPGRALELARVIDREASAVIEGVWTHFAKADQSDRSFTLHQIELFDSFLSELEREEIEAPLVHACNSAGLLAYPEAHYDLVRPGISLYGYPAGEGVVGIEPGLRPVMTLTAPVTFVKRVREGTPVSYGATWVASRETTIATVRYGYADGYHRVLGNRGWARVQGQKADVVGRICMDQLLLDVGDLQLRPGDRVTLMGPEGPDAAELGELAGSFAYEMLTSVSPRAQYVYGG